MPKALITSKSYQQPEYDTNNPSTTPTCKLQVGVSQHQLVGAQVQSVMSRSGLPSGLGKQHAWQREEAAFPKYDKKC
jgi:hypothetical protein